MIRNCRSTSWRKKKKARRSRAWLNGVEVSSRCFYADDRAGVVGLYKVNADGQKYVDPRTGSGAAREWLHGKVLIGRSA